MNFSHLSFGNNFVSMHQFNAAAKVVGSVQQNVAFIPTGSTQHYHNHSSLVNYSNNQATSAVVEHHNYQDNSSRIPIPNISLHSANATSTTTTTAAQTHWPDEVNSAQNDVIKVHVHNFPQAQGNHITKTVQRPVRTVRMHSISTMTDFENRVIGLLDKHSTQKHLVNSEDSDDSSKASTVDNQQTPVSEYPNRCSNIHLKSNASAMAEYLSRLQPTIPPSIQEFLKVHNINVKLTKLDSNHPKKDNETKHEIRLSTALDGSLLYCCAECHMAYPHKDLLERHLSVHKEERRFERNVCGICLKRKEHLDQHKRGHSEERPFVCEICCKGFKRNEHLRRHIVIHSGDKSHVCAQCGKGFSRKDHLNKHVQTHVGKRSKAELNDNPSSLIQLQTEKLILAYSPK